MNLLLSVVKGLAIAVLLVASFKAFSVMFWLEFRRTMALSAKLTIEEEEQNEHAAH